MDDSDEEEEAKPNPEIEKIKKKLEEERKKKEEAAKQAELKAAEKDKKVEDLTDYEESGKLSNPFLDNLDMSGEDEFELSASIKKKDTPQQTKPCVVKADFNDGFFKKTTEEEIEEAPVDDEIGEGGEDIVEESLPKEEKDLLVSGSN